MASCTDVEDHARTIDINDTSIAESIVPIIDISPIFGDDEQATRSLAERVKAVMQDVGFFQIRGHHFPSTHMNEFWEATTEFFDLPNERKCEIKMDAEYPYGYEQHEMLSLAFTNDSTETQEAFPDMKETFSFSLNTANGKFPTRFPKDGYFSSGDFSCRARNYYESMFQLAQKILEIFALALDEPRYFFVDRVQNHQSAVRMLNYPHQDVYLPGRTRASQHSDYGILTILKQDAVGGLQVRRDVEMSPDCSKSELRHHEWVDCRSPQDCFVVNIGDLMMRWTNDKWKSTVHRVLSPEIAAGRPNRRQSIAFFFNANPDCLVETFPSCIDPMSGESKYEAVIAGEYLMAKHSAATGKKS